jgi:hypothetical protein
MVILFTIGVERLVEPLTAVNILLFLITFLDVNEDPAERNECSP